MDVYLKNNNKKLKSTYQITYNNGLKLECKLKAPCDVIHPILVAEFSQASYAPLLTYNYAVIEWGNKTRYYFIDDYVFKNALVEIHLNEDFLATWKTEMCATTQYVLRSASSYTSNCTDTKYPLLTTDPTVVVPTGGYRENPLQPAANDYGVYVVGVVNKVGSVAGCVEYYAMSYLVFMVFCQKLFNLQTIWGNTGQDIADGIKMAITNPFQYVVSVIWLPYSTDDFRNRGIVDNAGSTHVYLGYTDVDLQVTCYPFSNSILNAEFTNLITIPTPAHPLANTRGAYLNREPYTRYYASFYPFCGLIELDGSKLKTSTHFLYTVDLRTGKGVLNICSDYSGTTYANWKPSQIIRTLEAQVGVPLPIAAIQTALPNTLGEFLMNAIVYTASEYGGFDQLANTLTTDIVNDIQEGNAYRGGGSIAQGYARQWGSEKVTSTNADKSTLIKDLSNIATGALSMKSTLEMIGSQGTISLNSRNPFAFWALCYTPANDNVTLFGRPLCASVVLNTLTGFVLCDTPRLQINYALSTEVATLENLLASGIYIE